jgi:hypothetical protein
LDRRYRFVAASISRSERNITPTRRKMLDALLVADTKTGRTPLSWLRQDMTRSSPMTP